MAKPPNPNLDIDSTLSKWVGYRRLGSFAAFTAIPVVLSAIVWSAAGCNPSVPYQTAQCMHFVHGGNALITLAVVAVGCVLTLLVWPRATIIGKKVDELLVAKHYDSIQSQIQQDLDALHAADERKAAELKEQQDALARAEAARQREKARKERLALAEAHSEHLQTLVRNIANGVPPTDFPIESNILLEEGEFLLGIWPVVLEAEKVRKTAAKTERHATASSSRESTRESASMRQSVSARPGRYAGVSVRVSPRVRVNSGRYGSVSRGVSSGRSAGYSTSNTSKTSDAFTTRTPSEAVHFLGEVDRGDFYLTNQRAVFLGELKHFDLKLTQLTAIKRRDAENLVTLGVQRLKSPYQIRGLNDVDPSIGFYLEAMLSIVNSDVDDFIASLRIDEKSFENFSEAPSSAGMSTKSSDEPPNDPTDESNWLVRLDALKVPISQFVASFADETRVSEDDLSTSISKLPAELVSGLTRQQAESVLRMLETAGGVGVIEMVTAK